VYQAPLFDHSDVGVVQNLKGNLYEQVDCLFDRWCFLCCRVRNLTRCTSGSTATAAPSVAAATAKAEAAPAAKPKQVVKKKLLL
jgi:hypothetical protein